jgi:hypothetical protein
MNGRCRARRAPAVAVRVQISSGGKSWPLRRISASRFADAELTTHRTMLHTAPNTQLRIRVCIAINP